MGQITLPDGRNCIEAVIASATEQWSEAILADGTVVRIKPVFTRILIVVDEYDATGNPACFVETTNVTSVSRGSRE